MERQLRFLDALAGTRSISDAAAAVGMSRRSAYRLRSRRDGALFAAIWDRALVGASSGFERHSGPMADGRLMRVLGNHFRRERGDFAAFADLTHGRRAPDRTGTS